MLAVPTMEEMNELLTALLKSLFPDIDTSPASFPALFTKVAAAAATDNHAHLTSVLADLLPDTASDEMLDRWGKIVGRPRKGATPARRAAALRLVNSSGSNVTVTAGTALAHVSTLRFQIAANAVVPAGDTYDADVVAIDTGSATRLPAGEVLSFATPITGIEEDAVLVLALNEDGTDREGAGPYRLRILDRFARPPLGGAQNDYVSWALEVTGIAAAFAYPARAGLGTVDVAALHAGTGSARLLSSTERTALQAYLDARRPVGVTVRVLLVLEEPESVEVAVLDTGEEGTAWDWIDEVPMFVDAWDAGTRTLTFSVDRPDSMQPGGRIVIRKVAGTGSGAPIVIESLSGTDAVVLEEAPDVAPVALDVVYAGGGLTDPVRAAITAHINGLGTANPDASSYGSWEGNLRPAALYRVVGAVPGVRDVEVAAPLVNVEATDPPYPADVAIGVMAPGRVLVRRKWA